MNDTVKLLIHVLLDPGATLSDRDDAAMDLGKFDDPLALEALIAVASSEPENTVLAASCGESIAEIWKRTGQYDAAVMSRLMPAAKSEIISILR